MLKLADLLDVAALNDRIKDGSIKMRRHLTEDLAIFNYSAKCQFDKLWTHETRTCRGLIVELPRMKMLNGDERVIARPFEKFFNLGEWREDEVPWHLPHVITEKLDGSLGVAYVRPSDGKVAIATRGAFHSPQAEHATKLLQERYPNWRPLDTETVLFEILYAGSRVVVDYGATDDLVLLTRIHTEHQLEYTRVGEGLWEWPGRIVKRFEGDRHGMMKAAATARGSVMEGFVVHFQNGMRIKVKADDYVRLHRLVCHLSKRSVWEILATGKSLAEFLELVPDEFMTWVKVKARELESAAEKLQSRCEQVVEDARLAHGEDRKAIAEFIKHKEPEYFGICFLMLDGKKGERLDPVTMKGKGWLAQIWRSIYPAPEVFHEVNEDVS